MSSTTVPIICIPLLAYLVTTLAPRLGCRGPHRMPGQNSQGTHHWVKIIGSAIVPTEFIVPGSRQLRFSHGTTFENGGDRSGERRLKYIFGRHIFAIQRGLFILRGAAGAAAPAASGVWRGDSRSAKGRQKCNDVQARPAGRKPASHPHTRLPICRDWRWWVLMDGGYRPESSYTSTIQH